MYKDDFLINAMSLYPGSFKEPDVAPSTNAESHGSLAGDNDIAIYGRNKSDIICTLGKKRKWEDMYMPKYKIADTVWSFKFTAVSFDLLSHIIYLSLKDNFPSGCSDPVKVKGLFKSIFSNK